MSPKTNNPAGAATLTGGAPTRRRVPRQARSRERVQRILDAARTLLVTEGPEALNTNRIAKEAEVGVGSVYEYFPDKHAIAFALLEDLSNRETALIISRFEALQDAPLAELVRGVVELSFTLYRDHNALYRALWSMTPIVRTVGSRPGEQLIVDAVKERLAPHAAALGIEDLDLTCWTAFHLVESLATQMVGHERFAPEVCIAEITKVTQRYLGLDHV